MLLTTLQSWDMIVKKKLTSLHLFEEETEDESEE